MTSTTSAGDSGTAGEQRPESSPRQQDNLVRLLGDALKEIIDRYAEPEEMTLREVAARTGISFRLLWDKCRADELEHYRVGQTYGMTRRQKALMLEEFTKGRSKTPAASQVMSRSRANASRGSRRTAA